MDLSLSQAGAVIETIIFNEYQMARHRSPFTSSGENVEFVLATPIYFTLKRLPLSNAQPQ